MAKNLRAKIPESDTMVINDVNDSATQQFVKEVGNVTIAKTVREVAEQTVCAIIAKTVPMVSFPGSRFEDDFHKRIRAMINAVQTVRDYT